MSKAPPSSSPDSPRSLQSSKRNEALRYALRAGPPGSWAPARGLARKALAPVERFLSIEAASGVLLLVAAATALLWANSPWRASYDRVWHTPLGVRLGPWAFEHDLHFWINDALMTIFFFVVGLEIRREIHQGELSELRRAALPLVAAVGGMLTPALVYFAFNHATPAAGGWGIPMATDIAFAVGVLALLGKRVPPALRILLLALAVIDDVGAILVIAIFYASGFQADGALLMLAGILAIALLQKIGVRKVAAYVPLGAVVWAGALRMGIHPTLAGVIVGLMTPAVAWIGPSGFVDVAERNARALREHAQDDESLVLSHLDQVDAARREAVSPVERLTHALHGVVAYGIMPLFALSNAGVTLGNAELHGPGLPVLLGVALGLFVGKFAGVVGFSLLSQKLGITRLPLGIRGRELAVLGLCAGIGFTMALFIAQLAFDPGPMLETAKLAILIASAISGVAAYLFGWKLLPTEHARGAARSASDAEASTLA